MRERIWIIGAKGRLGSELCQMLEEEFDEIMATDWDTDIRDLKTIVRYAGVNHPDVIINCAGYTNLQKCEENRNEAYRINAIGARNAAVAARKIDAKLIHISTDDIFENGGMEVYNEFDTPTPKTVYAKSKYAGETLVRELAPKHAIIRTSWLYGRNGDDFAEYVIQSAKEGRPIRVVKHSSGSPTSANALAKFIIELMSTEEYGVFHAACRGYCSREEFARRILEKLNLSGEFEYIDDKYRRSARMENMMMDLTGIFKMPTWQEALDKYLDGGVQ